MWQAIFDDYKAKGFMVLAIAMDTPDAARPWIEAAKPTYPCLIDRDHHVADIYNMVNVPQAVWIDEQGLMVRPPENAGGSDVFRQMDRQARTLAPDLVAERDRLKARYVAAIRDWAANGPQSRFAMDRDKLKARLRPADRSIGEAHAAFRLGTWLLRNGRSDDAARHFTEASRLHPQSWNIWRQAATKDQSGLATGPAFFARVDALGSRT